MQALMSQKLLYERNRFIYGIIVCWEIFASVYCSVFFFMYIPMRERSGSKPPHFQLCV